MKKGLLFSVLTSFFLSLSAQPVSRLYVFSREYYPGMVRQRDIPAENKGSVPKQPHSGTRYFIYAAIEGQALPAMRKIWLKGQWYSILQTEKVSRPVLSNPPGTKELIPDGKETILSILPGTRMEGKAASFPALRKMMQQQEAILCYLWRGKYYYRPLKKITLLDPVFSE